MGCSELGDICLPQEVGCWVPLQGTHGSCAPSAATPGAPLGRVQDADGESAPTGLSPLPGQVESAFPPAVSDLSTRGKLRLQIVSLQAGSVVVKLRVTVQDPEFPVGVSTLAPMLPRLWASRVFQIDQRGTLVHGRWETQRPRAALPAAGLPPASALESRLALGFHTGPIELGRLPGCC